MNCLMACLIVASVLVCLCTSTVPSEADWLKDQDTEDTSGEVIEVEPGSLLKLTSKDDSDPTFSRIRKFFAQVEVGRQHYMTTPTYETTSKKINSRHQRRRGPVVSRE